jgi:hypothetical protein
MFLWEFEFIIVLSSDSKVGCSELQKLESGLFRTPKTAKWAANCKVGCSELQSGLNCKVGCSELKPVPAVPKLNIVTILNAMLSIFHM